jgi:hypothetical protein
MYNQVYTRLTNVAATLGIAASSLYIGGPYVVMDSGSASNIMSNPSAVTGPWGVLDQRELDVISYWLTNKLGAGFVCVDGGNENKFGGEITDVFTRCDKFATVNNWISGQPGALGLPIVWAEWYNSTNGGATDDAFNDALGTYSAIGQLQSGAMLTLLWRAQASTGAEPPLWTATEQSGGGQATPWYFTYQTLNSSFGQGTAYYPTTCSSSTLAVLASETKTLVVNKTTNAFGVSIYATNITLGVEMTNITLGSYGVATVNAAPLSQVQFLKVSNATSIVACAGIPSYPYQLQRGTNLGFRGAVRLWSTNTPGTGSFQIIDDYSDLGTFPSSGFYRLRYNP